MAVCFYTLDGSPRGGMPQTGRARQMYETVLMSSFIDAHGGVDNLADAIDVALASTPAIDPTRLATCGHSSAGTIALMATAREPRIIAAATMAPATDLPKRFGQDFATSGTTQMQVFIYQQSPSAIEKLDAKVLIVHAPDDENVPFKDSKIFADKHAAAVTLVTTTGGHAGAYDRGRPLCFDFLAEQLSAKRLTAGAVRLTDPTNKRPVRQPPGTVKQ